MPVDRTISVLLITRGRPAMLRHCVESILAAGGSPELIAGVNGRDPESQEVLESFGGAVQTVSLPRMCRGEARNALVARARGRWLCFLDDDTVVPPGYFARLAALIEAEPGASVFGGGQELASEPGGLEEAVYSLLASPFGGGPFTQRFSPANGTRFSCPEKFILCNLTLEREFLKARGLSFEGHLSSAEENLLLNRMAGAGARMVLSGELNIVHRRRGDLRAFARQVFSCGRGRAQITLLSPLGFSPFTLLPPAGLALSVLSAFFAPGLLGSGAVVYSGAALIAAARSRARPQVKPIVLALFPVLHVSYAAGWCCGAIEGILERMSGRSTPGRCCCEEKP